MRIDHDTSVRTLAVEVPGATGVFDAYRIDYCCGGGRSLREACEKVAAPTGDVLRALEEALADKARRGAGRDWAAAPLAELIDHLVDTHHAYTRDALDALEPLADKVAARHGDTHPELTRVRALVADLTCDLRSHMLKEERVLFPLAVQLERAAAALPARPRAGSATVANPIMVMVSEHEAAGAILGELDELTAGYQPPAGACTSYRALYAALDELHRDLIQHIHLENNVLFPRLQRL
jgi:regulator of cell morphogenesis and NO signaling